MRLELILFFSHNQFTACGYVMCNNYAFKLKQKRNTNENLFANNIRHANPYLTNNKNITRAIRCTYSALPVGRVEVDVSDGKGRGSGGLTSSSKSPASVSGIMSGSAPE